MKDKISITPFYNIVDSVSQLYGSVIECKVTKNVIGGAIRDDVFQHKKESGHLKQCVQIP